MSEWRETTLGEVAEVVGGDVLWLTPGELTKRAGQVITSTERKITAEGLANSSAKMLPSGTVLLTSRATVGVVGLAGQPEISGKKVRGLPARFPHSASSDASSTSSRLWTTRSRR